MTGFDELHFYNLQAKFYQILSKLVKKIIADNNIGNYAVAYA